MARQRRIEYVGAIYHVMARGARRESIFWDDEDRKKFLETLGEVCEQTGWQIHAWVLMDNHYHWVLETPEANLVTGMKWFQNTYTRRFNSRHKVWGHLFGGRYKAIICEDDSGGGKGNQSAYFGDLVDYVHLNPIRAGLVDVEHGKGLLDYEWSSLKQAYGVNASKRPQWSCVDKALRSFGGRDEVRSRRKYISRLEKQVHGEQEERAGMALPEQQTLNSTLQRGWYWGSQQFRERLMKRLKRTEVGSNRNYRSSRQSREHGEKKASDIIEKGLKLAGVSRKELALRPGSDPVKVTIAYIIKKQTTVSLAWLAEALDMKSAPNVSQQVKRLKRGQIKPASWLEKLDDAVKN